MKHRTFTGMEMYAWSSNVTEIAAAHTGQPRRSRREANNYGGANYTGFSDPKMDADIAAAEGGAGPGQAEERSGPTCSASTPTQVPVIPLFFRAEAHITPHLAARLRSRPGRAT